MRVWDEESGGRGQGDFKMKFTRAMTNAMVVLQLHILSWELGRRGGG